MNGLVAPGIARSRCPDRIRTDRRGDTGADRPQLSRLRGGERVEDETLHQRLMARRGLGDLRVAFVRQYAEGESPVGRVDLPSHPSLDSSREIARDRRDSVQLA